MTVETLTFENVKIIFKNFSGKKTEYNAAGKRNFCVLIEDDDLAMHLKMDGWNVKDLKPYNEDDTIKHYIQVNVNYDKKPPIIFTIIKRKNKKIKTQLDENSVSTLDMCDIISADLSITPYNWNINGKEGVKGYLKSGYFIIDEDQFADKYADPDEEYLPFN